MKWIGTTISDNYIIEMTPKEWEDVAYNAKIEGIGMALKTYRKTNGMTQKGMALKIGISRTYYSMIEREKATNYSHAVYKKVLAAISYS